jgi:hypothetical protein
MTILKKYCIIKVVGWQVYFRQSRLHVLQATPD